VNVKIFKQFVAQSENFHDKLFFSRLLSKQTVKVEKSLQDFFDFCLILTGQKVKHISDRDI